MRIINISQEFIVLIPIPAWKRRGVNISNDKVGSNYFLANENDINTILYLIFVFSRNNKEQVFIKGSPHTIYKIKIKLDEMN